MEVCVVDIAGAFGPLNSYLELVGPLNSLGWSHTFVVPQHVASELTPRFPHASVRTVPVAGSWNRDRAVFQAVREAIDGGAALVHANTTSAARGAALALAPRRAPLIVHLRNSALSRGERLLLSGLLISPLRVATVAPSGAAADVAGRTVASQTTVVTDAVSPIPRRSARRLGQPARVGIVANLLPTKGFDVFVEIVARSTHLDVMFDVFGSVGMREPGSELVRSGRERLGSLDLQDRVCFHGVVPGLADHYQDFDVVLITSRRESFSRVAAEALLGSVPLVAPRIPGLMSTVGDGRFASLFDAGDPLSATTALEAVIANYDDALARAQAAREWAVSAFDPGNISRQIDAIYRSALGGRPRS